MPPTLPKQPRVVDLDIAPNGVETLFEINEDGDEVDITTWPVVVLLRLDDHRDGDYSRRQLLDKCGTVLLTYVYDVRGGGLICHAVLIEVHTPEKLKILLKNFEELDKVPDEL